MVVIQGKGLLILLVHNACWNNVPYGLDYRVLAVLILVQRQT